ncbi:hypothetical protein [Neptunomonas qingdaonensis]|uniref:Uncharacterized protein n=1 Tax=Neptunomonas qingdaonensis TaxID=1045558 RepID=A0A1I2QPV3_9GAMM|nr:hypothetical protein [Neptunomonas qingdaonensis]SFG30040.1 hypothetical protein SAMN05216175_10559 [Neptunomonas qingdaonensis]
MLSVDAIKKTKTKIACSKAKLWSEKMYSVAYKLSGGDDSRMSTIGSALGVIREGLPMTMFYIAAKVNGSQPAIFAALIGTSLHSLRRKKTIT